jgi:hypothetical protein
MSISSQQFHSPRGSVSLLGLIRQPAFKPGLGTIREFSARWRHFYHRHVKISTACMECLHHPGILDTKFSFWASFSPKKPLYQPQLAADLPLAQLLLIQYRGLCTAPANRCAARAVRTPCSKIEKVWIRK